jgi:hypothetical protein
VIGLLPDLDLGFGDYILQGVEWSIDDFVLLRDALSQILGDSSIETIHLVYGEVPMNAWGIDLNGINVVYHWYGPDTEIEQMFYDVGFGFGEIFVEPEGKLNFMPLFIWGWYMFDYPLSQ